MLDPSEVIFPPSDPSETTKASINTQHVKQGEQQDCQHVHGSFWKAFGRTAVKYAELQNVPGRGHK